MPTTKEYLGFLNKKKLAKVSTNFTQFELYFSNDALYKYKIANMPLNNAEALRVEGAWANLVNHVLQPVRDHFKQILNVSSGYRSAALNKKTKGVDTSQHCKGMAADIVVRNVSLQEIVKFIAKNLQFDQLILESSNGKNWVHVSYRAGFNRKQIMKYEHGIYLPYAV